MHNCHNRELAETVVAQRGWVDTELGDGTKTRLPRMVEIPFTMSRECHQWEEPFGAVTKGLLDPAGCEGCKWVPEAAYPADMQYMRR
jgi:hypothetical protein